MKKKGEEGAPQKGEKMGVFIGDLERGAENLEWRGCATVA